MWNYQVSNTNSPQQRINSLTVQNDFVKYISFFQDLAGRYAGFELSSIGTEEEITSEDRDFIDNSNMVRFH